MLACQYAVYSFCISSLSRRLIEHFLHLRLDWDFEKSVTDFRSPDSIADPILKDS